MSEKFTAFVPCRKGSQRTPRKNIKPFHTVERGLIEIKLKQLLKVERVDEILVSTDDDEILDFAASFGSDKIRLHKRAPHLTSSETLTKQIIDHSIDVVEEGHIMWAHVTAPFITAKHFDSIIEAYFKGLEEGHDSLMTTTPIQGFLWQDGKALNYDHQKEKWPRTQTMEPVHDVNCAVFLAHREVCVEHQDRIGSKPVLYGVDHLVGHDIDWPEDFILGELMLEKNLVEI